MDNVIDLRPHIVKKRKSNNAYGERLCCPVCDSYDYWRFYSKKHIDGKIHITAAMCSSDACDGATVVELDGGVIK